MTRVALYARVSTSEQAEGYGLGAQVDALRKEAARRGYHVVDEYVDEGYSGASIDRPAMNRLREAARAKAFDVVLLPALDRLARSMEVQAVFLTDFKRLNIKVALVGTKIEDTKEGRLLLTFLGGISEYERETIRDRMVGGKRRKASMGLVVTPRNAPYGYREDRENRGRLLIDEAEAEVVRLIYHLCVDEGLSLQRIAATLRREGKPARKGEWGTTQVARILTSDRYTGTVYYGQQRVLPDGTRQRGAEPIPISIPPIVTPERREAALAQLRKNKTVLVGRPATSRIF